MGPGGCKPESENLPSSLSYATVPDCTPIHADWVSPDLPNYCRAGVLRSPTMWLGIFTGGYACILYRRRPDSNTIANRIFTLLLMMYRVRGAILIGIFLTSAISWPRPTPVTYFPHTLPGDAAFDFFKQVVAFHPLKRIGNALDVCIS